ncbi:cation:proton antiporter [Pseudonocardia spirodelae]|uniref:Cation:proton antiporter n=1 Tax=Pseudonocardia spirodelae TaxID=3133431 RepID=A0ABU8T7V2_9PSEU
MQFTDLLVVCAVAFAAPLLARAGRRLRVPSPVLEIAAGVVLGPSVLGWVRVTPPVEVLALIGLAFLLFLAGLEIDVHRLGGPSLRLALAGFAASLALALALGTGLALAALGLTRAPLLVAVTLCATSLGLVVPVLKDAGEIDGSTGTLVVVASSVADFGAVLLLSLFFSEAATGLGTKLVLLSGLAVVAVLVVLALARIAMRAERVFAGLAGTTAHIRIRFAVLLLVVFVALAQGLGFEAILGAFLAGAVLRLVDTDAATVHPQTGLQLDAIGYGFVVPVFFVTSGIRFDAGALATSGAAQAQVPLFVVALLLVRGLPALLYRPRLGTRRAVAAGLLQATTLPFVVAAVEIGLRLRVLSPTTGAALVAAGMVSVLVFPAVASGLLRAAPPPAAPRAAGRARDADGAV